MDTPTHGIAAHDGARLLHAQIGLADVHAARVRQECDIRAIVHDEAHTLRSRRGRARRADAEMDPGNLEKFPAGSVFIAILQKLNPGFRHHFGERQLRRLEQSGVDYGIERREDKAHLGRRATWRARGAGAPENAYRGGRPRNPDRRKCAGAEAAKS